MFGRDRLVRIWTPQIGPGFAERLASASAPVGLLVILFPIWWVVGITHAISNGQVHTFLGALNAAFPALLLAVVVVTLIKLQIVRNAIRRTLSSRGFESASRPRVFTPSRFRSWLADLGLPAELAAEILIEEGRPKAESQGRIST